MTFISLIEPPEPPDHDVIVIGVRGSQVVIIDGDPPDEGVFLGIFDGRHCWATDVDVAPLAVELGPGGFQDLRRLWGSVEETTWSLAGRAVQLVEWTRTHRYCGRCGELTEAAKGERARRCPACNLLAFPRLAPAVITIIERDDGHALLARNRNFPPTLYSCLAGFVEPGETLEHAVQREVREEVGVEVGNIRYFASQPWPFPHSLMIGFLAEWTGGEIVIDETEIADAQWFSPDAPPMMPGRMSIARHLIDHWLARGV